MPLSPESPLPPGSVIGILGGGQLGRMLAVAAARLGLKCHILAPKGDNPAFEVAHRCTEASYHDDAALAEFARSVAIATYEFESVTVEAAETVAAVTPLAPGPGVLAVTQDRLREKSFMRDRGIQEQRGKMGRRTAELFWRCPDCDESGEAAKADVLEP